ncbi:outer membrane protein assembly factor BamE [Pusillimonas sp.]|uniref:outer membrane protein assembly factor BamE n=1 Tax=Pusillimonas sp. TaxID=3040095 RepID=UPI0037CC47C1
MALNLRNSVAVCVLALVLSACGSTKWGFPYRADVQQGNWVTAEQVARLEQGMTREQVRYVLGTPTLQDIFHANRWDYPYYNKPGYGDPEARHFTVWFENDLLVRWEGDEQPSYQPFQTPENESTPTAPDAERTDAPASGDKRLTSPEEAENATAAQETRAMPIGLETPSVLQSSSPNEPDSQPLR